MICIYVMRCEVERILLYTCTALVLLTLNEVSFNVMSCRVVSCCGVVTGVTRVSEELFPPETNVGHVHCPPGAQ